MMAQTLYCQQFRTYWAWLKSCLFAKSHINRNFRRKQRLDQTSWPSSSSYLSRHVQRRLSAQRPVSSDFRRTCWIQIQSVPGDEPGKFSKKQKMISEDSLPTKSRSLRAKSIAKRLATEINQSDGGRGAKNTKTPTKRSSSSSKHHPMSKYR